jgi:low affinity Fe/Cu permease
MAHEVLPDHVAIAANDRRVFSRIARSTATFTASPAAALLSILTTIAWLAIGPRMHFSDTWQLVMGSISSAVTFVMVFVLNNAQLRDTEAINAKLDALIIASEASNRLVALEREPEEHVQAIRDEQHIAAAE